MVIVVAMDVLQGEAMTVVEAEVHKDNANINTTVETITFLSATGKSLVNLHGYKGWLMTLIPVLLGLMRSLLLLLPHRLRQFRFLRMLTLLPIIVPIL